MEKRERRVFTAEFKQQLVDLYLAENRKLILLETMILHIRY